jgi:hypothetical protein
MLMSILAVTVRLIESATALLPASQRHQAGETYFKLAQRFLRISTNNLDIRYILALYRKLSHFSYASQKLMQDDRSRIVCRGSHWTYWLVFANRSFEMKGTDGTTQVQSLASLQRLSVWRSPLVCIVALWSSRWTR